MIEYIPEGGSWKDIPYEHLAPRFKKIRDDMKNIVHRIFIDDFLEMKYVEQ